MQGNDASPLLLVSNLSYEYGATQVLSDVSMELDDKRIALLVGRNGAGKSTLLRCLAGWAWANEGTVEIKGVPLKREDRDFRRHVLLVPDTPDFYDELTALEHLHFAAQLQRIANWREKSEELLERYGLLEFGDAFPFTFSRGMRYKLAMCIALLVEPPLLLLDEPFGPLDATSVHMLWQDLQKFRRAGRSVVLSSHTLPNADKPDVIFLLHNQTVEEIDPSEVTDLRDVLSRVD